MNQTIRELYERKSVRVFEDRQIGAEEREAILKSACMAPTAGNQQLYTIIDVKEQEIKEKLAELCDHQPFIAKADMVLIFCADCQKWYDAFVEAGCEPRNPGMGDLMLAVCDANVAAQNAVTAAWSLGIGSCYIGDIMEHCEEERELLHLPKYVFPVTMLVFGYPTEQQKARKKPERVNMQHVVHENVYRKMDGRELEEMLSPKAAAGSYEEWIKAFCNRKFNSDFSEEMTRSVEKYAEIFRNCN